MEAYKNSKITVLDGDPEVLANLVGIIRNWVLKADGFADPAAAREHIRNHGCDIVLLDLLTSRIDVRDLIPRIGSNLKIVVLARPEDKDQAIGALKLGAFDLLEKPIRKELLHHSLSRALTALKNERESRRLIGDLEQSRSALLAQQLRLEKLNTQLLDTNRALSVFAQNVEREREEIEARIALKLRNLLIPLVARMKDDRALREYEAHLDILTQQIEDLTSSFITESGVALTLSTTEMLVASLIKQGTKTEEIAKHLHISENTVRTHRKNIRRKLGINSQFSLRNFLNSKTKPRAACSAC